MITDFLFREAVAVAASNLQRKQIISVGGNYYAAIAYQSCKFLPLIYVHILTSIDASQPVVGEISQGRN